MKVSQAEQVYWNALERLKTNTAQIVNTKSSRFKFTRDAVGRESGKGKGYVRNERYPELCEAIKKAEEERLDFIPKILNNTAKLKHEKELRIKSDSKNAKLTKEYELLMQDYLNILRENFEIKANAANSSHIKLIKELEKKNDPITTQLI